MPQEIWGGIRERLASLTSRLERKPPETDAETVEYRAAAASIEDAAPPAVARSLLAVLSALIGIAIVWSLVARVDRVVVGQGRIVTLAPSIVLQPFENSIIQSVDVRIGQSVKRGQPLVQLDPTFARAEAAEARARVAVLSAEQARLRAELEGRPFVSTGDIEHEEQATIYAARTSEIRSRMAAMDASIARLQAEVSANSNAQELVAQRLTGIRRIEAARQELADQGLVARVSVYQATSERLENELQYRQRRDASSVARRDIERIRQERDAALASYRRETSERLAEVSTELDGIRSRLTVAERRAELVTLFSPADAMVIDVAPAARGAVADPSRPLVTLVALNVPLEGQIGIAPGDIARVRVGDRVRIKLEPFPFQRHGIVEGSVLALAEEAVQANADDPASLQYRARIKLERVELRDVPPDFRLYAGMPMTGEVVIGSRSVFSYLISPLIRTGDEAMREP